MDITSMTGSPGALAALQKDRDDEAAEKAKIMRMGRNVETDEQFESKVRGVAEEFVSVFMNQVMKSMRATVDENPAMHGDNGEKFFQDMLDTEQSKSLATGSGYGLTDLIYESMMSSYRMQQQPQSEAQPQITDSMEGTAEDSNDLAVHAIA